MSYTYFRNRLKSLKRENERNERLIRSTKADKPSLGATKESWEVFGGINVLSCTSPVRHPGR